MDYSAMLSVGGSCLQAMILLYKPKIKFFFFVARMRGRKNQIAIVRNVSNILFIITEEKGAINGIVTSIAIVRNFLTSRMQVGEKNK